MGSLTVRNLSEDVKKRLRLRAAANGRSMEEEIRLLLAAGAAEAPVTAKANAKPAKTVPSEAAASLYGLTILLWDIHDRPDNTTTFAVLERQA